MIHQKGITLSKEELARLEKSSMSQDRQIAMIFMARPSEALTFHNIVTATGFNQDSAKRSLSNMSGSGDLKKYKGKYGRFPLVKTDLKKINPDTGINITCYKWNMRYNQPPTHRELLEKHHNQGQINFNEL